MVGSAQPDSGKFNDIQAAYAVLSQPQSRANYDILRRKNPDAYREVSERDFKMTHSRGERDATGNIPQAAPAQGSYAELRMAQLKE